MLPLSSSTQSRKRYKVSLNLTQILTVRADLRTQKSGPLFSFDVVEDVRLIADATKEKEDAHAAKVVERRWYERNRHIFPASRWEVYDPTKTYSRYTIHGD